MRIKTIASSSAGCAYTIESGEEILLIECGVSVKKIRQFLDFDLSKVVGCIVSHSHGDHAKYLSDLEKTGIPIWCTIATKKAFKLQMASSIEESPIHDFGDNFSCISVKLEHDCPCYGFIIDCEGKRLAYFTDTGHANFKVPGITHLMIECNYSFEKLIDSENKFLAGRIADYHLSIEDVLDFCTRHKSTLQEIHLIHLSDANADEEDFQKQVAGATGVPVYISQK